MGKCYIDVTLRKKGSESDVRADSSTWTVLHNYHGYVRKRRPLAHCTGTGIGLHRAQILGPEKTCCNLCIISLAIQKRGDDKERHKLAGPGVQFLVSFEISKIDVITFQVLGTLNHSVGANSIYVI